MKKIDSFGGEHSFLSNFYDEPVRIDGITYPTSEHAYQAMKTDDLTIRKAFAKLKTAGEAKREGRRVKMRRDWDSVKIQEMERILEVKFAPGSDLAKSLVETGDAELVEGNYWGDTFWGVCKGVGRNELGKCLMRLRLKLRG